MTAIKEDKMKENRKPEMPPAISAVGCIIGALIIVYCFFIPRVYGFLVEFYSTYDDSSHGDNFVAFAVTGIPIFVLVFIGGLIRFRYRVKK